MKDKYPKAWADFEKWLKKSYMKSKDNLYMHPTNIYVFYNVWTFEMQLGVCLKYLDENNINALSLMSIESTSMIEILKQAIEQAFKIREEQLT